MKEIFLEIRELIKKISGGQAFVLLLAITIFAGAYFITDRIYDHIEREGETNKRMNELETNIRNLQIAIEYLK